MTRVGIVLFALLAAPAAALAQPAPAAPLLDGPAIVGPPPAPDTPGDAADRAGADASVSAERLALASRDQAVDPFLQFREIFGARFQAASLPRTARVFQSVLAAAIGPMNAAKERYARPRPYAGEPARYRCAGADLQALGPERSYPSGHAMLGYAWALTLAELTPAHADAVLARGVAYGDSRVICGVHWPSDVAAGRILGAAVLARLHADPAFRAQLDDARSELAPFAANER
jgi:acid phosphatase (class A)